MQGSARHRKESRQTGWLKIGIGIAFGIFTVVCIAGAYNAWWISAHCTTLFGILVC